MKYRDFPHLCRAGALSSLCSVAFLGAVLPAQAAWEIVPEVGIAILADDNPRLRVTSPGDSTSTVLDARVDFSTFGERGNLSLRPQVSTYIYAEPENEDLESDDFSLRMSGTYNWTRVRIAFDGYFAEQSIRRSELVDPTPDDPDFEGPPLDVDTGRLIFFDEKRNDSQFIPTFELRISDRSLFVIEATSIDVTYAQQRDFRSDFEDDRIEIGIVRRVDERNEVSAKFVASEYFAPQNSNTTNIAGVEGSFTRPLSENWTFSLSAGVNRTDFEFIDNGRVINNADTNFSYWLTFRKRTILSSLNIDFGRNENPSGTGFVELRDQLRLYSSRDFSPRLTGSIGAVFIQTQSLNSVQDQEKRDYQSVNLEIEWAVAPQWLLTAGYNYIFQEFSELDGSAATSNSVYLGINFRGLSSQ